MRAVDHTPEEELVLLGQAGYGVEDVRFQVSEICKSPPFDNQVLARKMLIFLVDQALAGRVPTVADVAMHLGKRDFGSDDSYVRSPKKRLVDGLQAHYAQFAKPGELHLEILAKTYIVVAQRRREAQPGHDSLSAASILEPSEQAEVYRCVPVRGRIDLLHPDLRVWLVVLVSGLYYPQSWVSRQCPSWSGEVRVGVVTKGEADGVEFLIMLIAVAIDGDHVFWEHLKTKGHALGIAFLPTDTKVLDTRRVIRRDIRPND